METIYEANSLNVGHSITKTTWRSTNRKKLNIVPRSSWKTSTINDSTNDVDPTNAPKIQKLESRIRKLKGLNIKWSNPYGDQTTHYINFVATSLWPSVGVKPNTPKVGDLESSGTPECLEFDSKAQNTLHWGVLSVIEKVLKRRYRKWPRIGHLDICSPSYGQKKGRESNWHFDSRPLKVKNRPLSDLRIESATQRWKDLDEGYKFGSDLVAIKLCSRELWAPKVPGLHPGQFRDNFGTPTWESREKEPFGCSLSGASQRILYGGRWWLPPSPGRGESCGPKCPWLVPRVSRNVN
jgi:hypothetical protein